MAEKLITAKNQRLSAQGFNFFSCIAVMVPVLIPIWIAASIFVYASSAYHPNPRVCEFIRHGGYRFYGLVGALVAVLNFSSQMAKWVGGGWNLALIIWGIAILVVVPLGLRDILRAQKAPWQDMTVEV